MHLQIRLQNMPTQKMLSGPEDMLLLLTYRSCHQKARVSMATAHETMHITSIKPTKRMQRILNIFTQFCDIINKVANTTWG